MLKNRNKTRSASQNENPKILRRGYNRRERGQRANLCSILQICNRVLELTIKCRIQVAISAQTPVGIRQRQKSVDQSQQTLRDIQRKHLNLLGLEFLRLQQTEGGQEVPGGVHGQGQGRPGRPRVVLLGQHQGPAAVQGHPGEQGRRRAAGLRVRHQESQPRSWTSLCHRQEGYAAMLGLGERQPQGAQGVTGRGGS